jgi:cytochrome d ubiquinol oxidase subunit II
MTATILAGLLVFLAASLDGHDLLPEFSRSTTSVITLVQATILCPGIWHFLNRKKNKTAYLRIGVSMQVTLILIGWFYIQFPVLKKVSEGSSLTFFNSQAPGATILQLLIALVTGLVVIVPGFVYLFKVFKIHSDASLSSPSK